MGDGFSDICAEEIDPLKFDLNQSEASVSVNGPPVGNTEVQPVLLVEENVQGDPDLVDTQRSIKPLEARFELFTLPLNASIASDGGSGNIIVFNCSHSDPYKTLGERTWPVKLTPSRYSSRKLSTIVKQQLTVPPHAGSVGAGAKPDAGTTRAANHANASQTRISLSTEAE